MSDKFQVEITQKGEADWMYTISYQFEPDKMYCEIASGFRSKSRAKAERAANIALKYLRAHPPEGITEVVNDDR